jgi:hypothetical protein
MADDATIATIPGVADQPAKVRFFGARRRARQLSYEETPRRARLGRDRKG